MEALVVASTAEASFMMSTRPDSCLFSWHSLQNVRHTHTDVVIKFVVR